MPHLNAPSFFALACLLVGCSSRRPNAQTSSEVATDQRGADLLDAGARYWVSEPTTVSGGKPVVALVSIEVVPPDEATGALADATSHLMVRLYHELENRTVCSAVGASSCTGCAMSSTDLPEDLDCTLYAGSTHEVARTVTLDESGTVLRLTLDGTTEYERYDEPIPHEYRLRSTSALELVWGPLSSLSFDNSSSESARFRPLVGPLQHAADRQENRLDDVASAVAERGVDPARLTLDAAIRIHDAARKADREFGACPDARDEVFGEDLERILTRLALQPWSDAGE